MANPIASRTQQRPLWHPLEWPAWLGLALIWLLSRLPYRFNFWISSAFGWWLAIALRLSRRARVAQININVCFAELSESDRANLVQRNLRNTGHLIGEFCFAWAASLRNSSQIAVSFQGAEHLQTALALGKGVILVGAHFSHLELCGRLLAERLNIAPIAGMYREHRSAAFEFMVRRWRLRYAQAMFRRDELRGCIRWLKSGNLLWYAPDQDYRRGESVFVPFFGEPAASLSATHQLARLSGAAVVGFAHQRLNDGSFNITLEPMLSEFPSNDVIADTARVNSMLEAIIRRAPEQYLWLHQRFKSRPEGSGAVY
jgi:Kdo2-lipid IVA lauroyltransferase/acyltransferase